MRSLLIAALLAMSGCLAASPAACEAANCHSPDDPSERATLSTMVLEGCHGVRGGVYIPEALGRLPLRPAFRLEGVVPASARFDVEAYACERVTGPSHVSAHVSLLWVSLSIRARNETWNRGADDAQYVLEVFVSDANVSNALASAGLPARVASFQDRSAPAVALDSFTTWSFVARSGAYGLEFPVLSGPPHALPTQARHLWVGDGSYGRFESKSSHETPLVPFTAGLLTATGDAALRHADGLDLHPFEAKSLASTRWDIQLIPQIFKEN